ncbi:MAG: DUF4097 family beta strand repeat-containing protein [Thermoanaerobaculales bacterium]
MKLRGAVTIFALLAAPLLAAERREVTTRSFPAPDGKLVLIDAGPLDLQVRAADIHDIRVRVELVAAAFSEAQAASWIELHRPTIEDSESQLRIQAPDPSGISLLKGVLVTRARIEVTLPPSVRPDLSTSSGTLRADGEFSVAKPLRLRTASGDSEFTGWASEIEVRSTSGDMQVHASRAIDTLMARTASGSLLLVGGARTVRCDASSGDIHLEGLLGPVNAVTSSGSVVARFDALGATDEVHVSTSSGKVRITLPPGSQPGGELRSAKGEIRSAYPGESDPKGGLLKLSGAGTKLTVTTTSGRIDLN